MRLDRLHKPRRSISEEQPKDWSIEAGGQPMGGPTARRGGKQQQITPNQQKLLGVLQSIAYQQGLSTDLVKGLTQDIYGRLSYGRQRGYSFLKDGDPGDTATAKLGGRKVHIKIIEQSEKGSATVLQVLQAMGFKQSTASQIISKHRLDGGEDGSPSYNIGPISQLIKEPAKTGKYADPLWYQTPEPKPKEKEREFKYRGPAEPTKMKAAKAAAKKKRKPEETPLLGVGAPSEPEQRGVIDPEKEITAEPEVAAEPAAEPVAAEPAAAPVKAKAKPKKKRRKAKEKAPVQKATPAPTPSVEPGMPDPDVGEFGPGEVRAGEKKKKTRVFNKVAKLVKSGLTSPDQLGKAVYGDNYDKKRHAGPIARAAKKALKAQKAERGLAVTGGRAKVGEVGAKKKKRKRKSKKKVTTDDIVRRIADLIDEDEIF